MRPLQAAAMCCALTALVAGAANISPAVDRALADDLSTPTAPAIATQVATEPVTLEPTVAVPTPVVDTPTSPPTVTQEGGRPIATVAIPTPAPTVRVPVSHATDVLPTPKSRVALSTPGTTGTAAVAQTQTTAVPIPTAPAYVPLPSAAQLQESARQRWGTSVPQSVKQWAFLIAPAARKYGVPPTLVAAVMTMESNGDPLALSGADARGLMQVLHGPWDPKENVFTGVRMLAEYYQEFGDWTLALAAYNAGPNAVITYNGVPPYRETHDYVIIVTYLWDLYSNHHLSSKRKALYRSTLHDLQHFKQDRKKVKALASVARVQADPLLTCAGKSCDVAAQALSPPSLDPFWPMGTAPDPLQQVDPPPPAH